MNNIFDGHGPYDSFWLARFLRPFFLLSMDAPIGHSEIIVVYISLYERPATGRALQGSDDFVRELSREPYGHTEIKNAYISLYECPAAGRALQVSDDFFRELNCEPSGPAGNVCKYAVWQLVQILANEGRALTD